jgi:hypothetical protein
MSEIVNETNEQSFKKLTANQVFKQYKDEGGTLNFSDFLTREKTKGVFPLNSSLNEEINSSLKEIKKNKDMKKTFFGFPTKTLIIAGAIVVVGIVAATMLNKKK